MGEDNGYIKYTQQIIDQLCRGERKIIEKCGTQMQWSLPPHNRLIRAKSEQLNKALMLLSKHVKEVAHLEYFAVTQESGNAVVCGKFCTYIREENGICQEQSYCVHVFFLHGKTVYLEIEPRKSMGECLELRNIDREKRFLWENEIIYVEAKNDHLFWKCRLDVIETTGTLTEEEKKLSNHFIRIHRSYIINKNHVAEIHRFEVIMDNGDAIQIPAKKYAKIKEKIKV